MNQRAAFDALVSLAQHRNMPEMPGSKLGLAHIRDMRDRITPEFSEAKLGRWLGWAQCAVVASGTASLHEMKQMNRRHSEPEQ